MTNQTLQSSAEATTRYQSRKLGLHREIVEAIDLSRVSKWSEDRVRQELRTVAQRIVASNKAYADETNREAVIDDILAEAFGTGPIESFMNDPTVTEIMVNGPREVYVERDGNLQLTDVCFADDAHVMQVIQRIAARVGRRIDQSSPMVDARMPDGSRVNAIVPPLALDGPVLSIRRFGVRHQIEDLLANGTLPDEIMLLVKAAVHARLGVIISGGTGAGKTTLLNCLSRFIPLRERLVTIEDSAELQLQRPHVVRLETRAPSLDGTGEVTTRQLVRNSLRMRPDRIIIGEVRGAEALDMLQAMNTGHEGSMTTIHANSTRDSMARLEMMVTMAKLELPIDSIRRHIALGIRLAIQVARLRGGQRRVVGVSEILRRRSGDYAVRDLFVFQPATEREGQAVGHFRCTGVVPRFLPHLQLAGCDLPEGIFRERTMQTSGDDSSPPPREHRE